MMGVLSFAGGVLLGLLTAYLVQKKNNPYWPYEPWHHSTTELAWNAALSTLVAVIAFYFHSGDIYLIVVKWPPPKLFDCQFGGTATKENRMKPKCTYIPIIWLTVGHSYASWVYLFWTIEKSLIILPFAVSCVFCGAFSEFTAKKCRRLIKFGCGRQSYDMLSTAASSVAFSLAIEGEPDIQYTLDMKPNPVLQYSDSDDDDDEEESFSEDTSESESDTVENPKTHYPFASSSSDSSDENASDDDGRLNQADEDRKKVLEQMKNRRMSTVRVKQMNAWMHDDELESRAPQGVQHV